MMMTIYRLLKILREEPEDWIAYQFGQILDEVMPVVHKWYRPASVFRWVKIFLQVLRNNWRRDKDLQPIKIVVDYVVYAETRNQASALDTTLRCLKSSECSVASLTEPYSWLIESEYDYRPIWLTTIDVLNILILAVLRSWSLFRRLKKCHPLAIRQFLIEFLKVYMYLVLFERALRTANPKFVLLANDHCSDTRSLISVARSLGISTVYLQHASVSDMFPALRVTYAFLDGINALELYRKCESKANKTIREYNYPIIFLSGQKKRLKTKELYSTEYIGLAINTLDPPDAIDKVVQTILKNKRKVILRWHPSQPQQEIDAFIEKYENIPKIKLNNPKESSLEDFFSQINLVIAGNSSVLLEAILSNVNPIYYNFDSNTYNDYYQYVRKGLAIQAHNLNEIGEICLREPSITDLQRQAVKEYSYTYGTEWQGREGELVAQHLIALAKGENPQNLYGYVPF